MAGEDPVEHKGDCETQYCGYPEPVPVAEDGGDDEFLIETLSAVELETGLRGMYIVLHHYFK
jgi:hypothetical protein